ncbi:PD-(D/E)XK motif protein [Streptomyces meridianus]|uniref:PD-(D/E)XK motif protein n=1 Tax=Streptomyces meridianus TaxID=2938945 RepID=A0ABT0WZW8_9ACTN|nr:PD-(D/E)XK motif protein [Streptomyces meridianus]MCM2575862.1 PD-(D/E)XK motif protein [Streptomyces meridianus]
MTSEPSEQLYASWEKVKPFIEARRSATLLLNGARSPRVDYCVTDDGSIALELELASRQRVPSSPIPLVRTEEIFRNGLRMARLRLTQQGLLRDFHDMLNAVADRVIVHRRTPDQAFNETVRAWRALLEKPRQLSTEKRIGVIGELMLLAVVAETTGWPSAVDSWKGPAGEEHDFGLPGYDVEVKTTSSEQRHHEIQGLGQLTPSPGRPLWLVSVQLTRGGTHGRTLAERIEEIRRRLSEESPVHLDRFDGRLAAVGWSVDQPDGERWSLRSAALALPVDDRLPRLDDGLFESLPTDHRTRIDHITYRIDLTGLMPGSSLPTELATLQQL